MHTYRFIVTAVADAQSLSRFIGYLAQRDLTPSSVEARMERERMAIVITQPGLAPEAAAIIAEKMRSEVLAESVSLLADA